MQNVLLIVARYVAIPFLLVVIFMEYLGILFLACAIAAAIVGWGFAIDAGFTYLSIAWKVYVGLVVFTFAFLTTFSFQHCCVGLNSFRSHLAHSEWADVRENLLGALVWPWTWFCLGNNLRAWGYSLPDAVINAIAFWVSGSWRGTTLTHVDVRTGEETTTRVKSPEDFQRVLTDVLTKDTPKQ